MWRYARYMLYILVVGWIIVGVGYGQIPDPLTTHFGLDGQPDGWAPKTLVNTFGFVALGLGIMLLAYIFTGLVIRGTQRSGSMGTGKPSQAELTKLRDEGEATVVVTGILLTCVAAVLEVLLVVALFGVLQGPGMTVLVVVGLIIAFVAPAYWGEKRMRTLRKKYPDDEYFAHLKGGMFYYDPEDKRAMVTRRNGMSTQVNFASAGGKAVVVVLIAVIVGTIAAIAWGA